MIGSLIGTLVYVMYIFTDDNKNGKVFRNGNVRYNWPMSAHVSQAFSIAHCTDLEDLPKNVIMSFVNFHRGYNLRSRTGRRPIRTSKLVMGWTCYVPNNPNLTLTVNLSSWALRKMGQVKCRRCDDQFAKDEGKIFINFCL